MISPLNETKNLLCHADLHSLTISFVDDVLIIIPALWYNGCPYYHLSLNFKHHPNYFRVQLLKPALFSL